MEVLEGSSILVWGIEVQGVGMSMGNTAWGEWLKSEAEEGRSCSFLAASDELSGLLYSAVSPCCTTCQCAVQVERA